jgi:hypothetical protein
MPEVLPAIRLARRKAPAKQAQMQKTASLYEKTAP